MADAVMTPLHLAASLLALFAAAGLAVVVFTRPGHPPGRPPPAAEGRTPDLIVVFGALLVAVSHGLSGALVTGVGDTVAWLRAGGLALVALGLSGRSMADLSGAAVLIPVAPVSAAAVSAVAGGLAGLRALLGGRRTALVGLGLLTWGVAEGVARSSVSAAGWLTLVGSLAIGAWLWQASARRLLAKFVTAFVASLLVVVVVIAGIQSGLGSADLVREELRRLDGSAERVAAELAAWPDEAEETSRPFTLAGESLVRDLPTGGEEAVDRVYEALFSTQDFFVLLDGDGSVLAAFTPPELEREPLLLGIRGSRVVEELLAGATGAGEFITVGGELVAVGGVRLLEVLGEAAQEPLGVLLTGRVADDVWVERAALPDVGVIVEVGAQRSVASRDVADQADQVVARLDGGEARESLTVGEELWYASAVPILDASERPVARVIALSSADTIAQLERDQVQRLFLLALVGALFAGTVAVAVAGRLVAPIRRLTAAAAAVREGDLRAETAIDSPDEVGELGRTFNEMTASLAAQSAQLRDAAAVQSRLRARMEALTSSMGDALVAVDADGKVIAFNPAAERLVGRDVTDVLGLPLEEVLRGRGPGDTPAVAHLGAPDSEDVVAVQLLLDNHNREPVPTAVTAAPVRDGRGEILGRVLVLRDVTREVEIERMKTEFLANVSHELRTPLTPIKGYADVLARRDVDPETTRRFAGQILAGSARLERIVQMVVDFAALDSGRLRLVREPVMLSDLVGEALDEWRGRCPDREFRRRVAKSLPPVFVDPGMLRRCLDELLDNAVKFSPGGEPVSVSARMLPGSPDVVRLSVRDRGVGIEPETAARLFSDFYQVDASETRHYGGLGLGLALVRRIIDGLGGEASVESHGERGSSVHLLLPVAPPAG